jgi:FdhD protein
MTTSDRAPAPTTTWAVERMSTARSAGPAGPAEAAGRVAIEDVVVTEAPLELRLRGAPYVVVMRTPGADAELARGLLFAERMIGAGEAVGMSEPPDLAAGERGNVLDLDLDPARAAPRSMVSTSSCGVCGKTAISDLVTAGPICDAPLRVRASVIASLPDRLRAAQALFETTGGLHAAGAFSVEGELLCLREDVGRHNAVDKVVGWALGAGRVPLHDAILCVSGRLGYEIAQKAVMVGFPLIAAVSAPSSMAIEVADRHRVAVCGFVRGGRFNVYCGGQRVVDG